jgi:hypothetical protein
VDHDLGGVHAAEVPSDWQSAVAAGELGPNCAG